MPYSSIDELPEPVRNSLPQHGQEIWMATFNSAKEQGKDDETCAKIAWSAVKKSYEKVDGKWQAIKNMQTVAMFMNVEILNASHEAILQTLNRDIGGYYFPSEAFANNVTAWSSIPIIYASDHPDMKLFLENPKLALDKIKGRIVGEVTMPRIETVGHPRLMANMDINDPEVNKLIELGKISHSTGFIGKVDGKNITSVNPNHVLVFMEDANNLPKDRGAFILNKEDEIDFQNANKKPYGDVEYADPGYQEDGVYRYPLDTEKHVRAAWSYINMPKNQKAYSADQLSKIKAKIESAAKKFGIEIKNMEIDMANQTKDDIKSVLKELQSHPEMMDDEMKSMMKDMKNKEQETEMTEDKAELAKQLEISNKATETLKAELDGTKKELANKVEQLKVFEQKEAERKTAEENARWQEIKNKLPIGLTHKPEDEKVLRDMWIANKDTFYMQHFVNKDEKKLPGEEGKAIVNAEDAKAKQGFTVGGIYTTEA